MSAHAGNAATNIKAQARDTSAFIDAILLCSEGVNESGVAMRQRGTSSALP
jgi:hypothetical protein